MGLKFGEELGETNTVRERRTSLADRLAARGEDGPQTREKGAP